MTSCMNVLVTMDCEPPAKPGAKNASGPRDWDESDRYIKGYDAIAAGHGFPVSYFLHPEVAETHAGLFHALEADGACIDGLHLHPWKFDEANFRAHFGGLDKEQQREILTNASAVYARHIGRQPRYFRPGTFSANDNTFPLLVEMGFEGGSVSAPERVFPDLNAVWTGAPKDPHKAHGIFRQNPGDLPFVNIPLTSDFSAAGMLNGRAYFRDLRPDYDDTEEGFARIVGNIVDQVIERGPDVPVILIVTHNDNAYDDPENQIARNFDFILGEIRTACEARGIAAKGATVADIVETLRPVSPTLPPFVYA